MIGWQSTFYMAKSLERLHQYKKAIAVYTKLSASTNQHNPRILFSLGNCLYQNQEIEPAIKNIEMAIALDDTVASWHYRLGFILERRKQWSEALEQYLRAVELDATRPAWHFRLARCHYGLKNISAGDQSIRTAIELNPNSENYYDILARSLNKQGKTWQEIEVLEAGAPANKESKDWTLRLALAYSAMNKTLMAATTFEKLRQTRGLDPEYLFLEGRQWDLLGDKAKATSCYSLAVESQDNTDQQILGIGYFFENNGLWNEAIQSYSLQLIQQPENVEILARLAKLYRLVRDYDNSIQNYEKAIRIGPAKPGWFHQLAKVYEKTNSYSEALHNYNCASKVDGKTPFDSNYRAAAVLEKLERYTEAVEAYKQHAALHKLDSYRLHAGAVLQTTSLDIDDTMGNQLSTREHLLHTSKDWLELSALALDFELAGAMDEAREYYHRAYMSSPGGNSWLIFRYGLSVERMGDQKNACSIYRQMMSTQGLTMSDTLNDGYGTASGRNAFYAESYDETALTNTVLYESNHGSSATCNPLAIYEAAINDPRLADFDHVWVVNEIVQLPASIANNPKAHVVAKHSVQYRRQLASAQYLVSNSTFPTYFIRRDGQEYLNTWHGTPLKLMGKRVKEGDFEHRNVTRNLLQVSKLLAPNQHTLDCLIRDHQIDGLFSGEIARVGTPRIDTTIRRMNSGRAELYEALGIDAASNLPVVLYAPTWRGGMGSRTFDSDRLIADLTSLGNMDIHLVFRAHQFAEVAIADLDIEAIVAPPSISTNDLLGVTDVLITDYSSIFFDFLVTKRPILFYAYDLEDYVSHRGLYFPMTNLPGKTVEDISLLIDSLEAIIGNSQDVDSTYLNAVDEFAAQEDGFAAERAVDFMLTPSTQTTARANGYPAASNRSSLLFYQGSFMPNGITTAFLSLVKALDPRKYLVTVVIEPDSVFGQSENVEKFRQLPDHVRVVPRTGAQLRKADENCAIKHFAQNGDFPIGDLDSPYRNSYRREFDRIFGNTRFDVIIDFEGYSSHWASILGLSGRTNTRHAIYLHNDMHAEWQTRFPSLSRIFTLYSYFEALVSVSKSVHEMNVLQLSEQFGIEESKFLWADNLVDAEKIRLGGRHLMPASLQGHFTESLTTFVTMGRLSPEKDHAKLIDAFSVVHTTHPETRLIILGDGPLRQVLNSQILRAGLDGVVVLAGLQENPFAIVKRANCFVFSSNYEGQGLALIEALILGLPVISTDVIGPRSVLEHGHGLLVDNSIDGLVNGMKLFLSGKMVHPMFDENEYQDRAIRHFERAIN